MHLLTDTVAQRIDTHRRELIGDREVVLTLGMQRLEPATSEATGQDGQ
ncbi:MAG: hypothetical protein Tsb0032_07200 [Kiloniellaceae bacterium]